MVGLSYGKDCASAMTPTSNAPTNNLDGFFAGNDAPPCALDRLFGRASALATKGASFRGAELEVSSAEASPMAIKMNKRVRMNWKCRDNNRDCWRIGETNLAGIGDSRPTWAILA